ncbi:MAG: hypothetical protein CM15mP74_33930 [Halieaceae bacterium]|nr:MAG: hypothetical protein CM15mP74_33930 [Halieaceae bacterium]
MVIPMTESSRYPCTWWSDMEAQIWALRPDHPEYGAPELAVPQRCHLTFPRQYSFVTWFRSRLNEGCGAAQIMRNGFTRACAGSIATGRWRSTGTKPSHRRHRFAFALYLGEVLARDKHYKPQVREYLDRMRARPAFERSKIGEELSL